MLKVTPKMTTAGQKAYNNAMANLLQHSDRDFLNLKLAQKVPQAVVEPPKISFTEGLKNFFEKGMMTFIK